MVGISAARRIGTVLVLGTRLTFSFADSIILVEVDTEDINQPAPLPVLSTMLSSGGPRTPRPYSRIVCSDRRRRGIAS